MKHLSREEGVAVGVAIIAVLGVLFYGNVIFHPQTQTASVQTGSNSENSGVVKVGDTVSVSYIGTLSDGTQFDNSYDRGQPLIFQVGSGQLIKGFDNGVVGMHVGEKRHIVIPPEEGYGDRANGPIPANATLIFDVELVKIGN